MSDSTPAATLQHLALFHGQLSPQQAYVYVRLTGGGDTSGWQLRGKIQGPVNHLTRTLPATVPLRNMGAGPDQTGPDLLLRAIVPDPCFWAPAQPYRYHVHVELVADHQVVASATRSFGMRMLGVHEQRIFWESHPWQLLGAEERGVEATDNAAWRGAALARRSQAPSDQQCELASRDGVMLLADLEHTVATDAQQLASELIRLSRHAAVAMVALPAGAELTPQLRDRVPNLLIAQRCSAATAIAPHSWADVALCELDDLPTLRNQLQGCRIPVLIQQVGGGAAPIAEVAQRCRQLVVTLEPLECVAGCLV